MDNNKKTYIINIDGLPGQYLDIKDKNGEYLMKYIREFAGEGVRFLSCTSILPAVTACNHTTIVTSTSPGTSGVYNVGSYYKGLDKQFKPICLDYAPANILAKTLMETYKEHNLKTAVVSGKGWVGRMLSGSSDILVVGDLGKEEIYNSIKPDYWEPPTPYIYGGELDREDQAFPPRVYVGEYDDGSKKYDRADELLERHYTEIKINGKHYITLPLLHCGIAPGSEWIMKMSKEVIKRDNPDFMYILFSTIDMGGHSYGSLCDPESLNLIDNMDAKADVARDIDGKIKSLIDFIRDTNPDSQIIITSDHGMSTTGTGENLKLQVYKTLARNSHVLPYYLGIIYRLYSMGMLCVNLTDVHFFIKNAAPEKQEQLVHFLETLIKRLREENKELNSIIGQQGLKSDYSKYSIDIRAILKEKGFRMRAYTGNGSGDYDWALVEGPNGYIFNVGTAATRTAMVEKMKKALYEYNISHRMPIWEILDQRDQKESINRKIARPFNLYNEDIIKYGKSDLIWPDFFLFLDRNHTFTLYEDIITGGFIAGKMKPENYPDEKIDFTVPAAPGIHGTYQDQHVPLVFLGKGIKRGFISERSVTTRDIAPTILGLNGWSKDEMPKMEG
ncbi:MAG: hypothetical protein QG657_371, partial [Acidobacteriota bacterium]|nr:hypothetical protein [Acidobacteriota bacterium]